MRKITMFMTAILLMGACASSSGKVAPPGGLRPASGSGDQTAAIYASVIRQLITKDGGFGSAGPPYKVIYVLDGPVTGAGDPNTTLPELKPGPAFGQTLEEEIRSHLSQLLPVHFVHRRSQVAVGTKGADPLGHVKHFGVLIMVAPIKNVSSNEVQVGNNRWVTGLNGQWLTYVVTEHSGQWHVTGVAGKSTAIS